MRRFLFLISILTASAFLLAPATFAGKTKQQKVKTIDAFAVVDSATNVDNDPAGDSQGDIIVFTQKIFTDQTMTKQIGTDEAYCVRTVAGAKRLCTGMFELAGGQITITGPESDGVHSLVITGGTGKYLGARGEVVLNSIDPVSDTVKFRILR